MMSVNLSRKWIPESIRFRVYSLKSPGTINYDTVKVAEFVLKKF